MGLVDLLPDSVDGDERKRIAQKIAKAREKNCGVPTKEEIARKKAALREANRGFNSGRKRSLEWNDEIAHKGVGGFGENGRKKKRKKKRKKVG